MSKAPHRFTPDLFARISKNRRSGTVNDSIQEEVANLLSCAVRGGTTVFSENQPAWRSVLNYGLPALPMLAAAQADPSAVIGHLHRMLPVFEPRINGNSLQVRLLEHDELGYQPAHFEMLFEIEAQTTGPRPEPVNFRISLDYTNGIAQVVGRHAR